MTEQLKEPTDAMIMTDYMLEKYVRKGTQYLWKAYQCIGTAVKQAKASGDDVRLMDLVEERKAIIQLIDITQNAQNVHRSLAAKMKEAGYRDITDAELAELGVNSNR